MLEEGSTDVSSVSLYDQDEVDAGITTIYRGTPHNISKEPYCITYAACREKVWSNSPSLNNFSYYSNNGRTPTTYGRAKPTAKSRLIRVRINRNQY